MTENSDERCFVRSILCYSLLVIKLCSKWQTKHQPVVVEEDLVDVVGDVVEAEEGGGVGEESLKIKK